MYLINGAIYHKGVKQEAIALPWFYLQANALFKVVAYIHIFPIL
jgi:hypothetical protein